MKKFFVLLIITIPFIINAQEWEAGVFLGASNYSGDLSPTPIVLSETHGALGALVRYNMNENLTIKGNIYFGKISGSDENAESVKKTQRNLSFRSNVLEFGIHTEWNILGYEPGSVQNSFSPYFFTGINLFRFNPQAQFTGQVGNKYYDNEWVDLQPLGTEGQESTKYQDRKKYPLTQLSIPLGAGIKISVSDYINIGMEVGTRKTFTDYLDDVSTTYVERDVLVGTHGQLAYELSNRSKGPDGERINFPPLEERGNANTQDWYMFAGVFITYTFRSNPCPTF